MRRTPGGNIADMVIAIVAALAAGASFAVAGVLQQRAAATRPQNESLSFRLVADLLHQRLWLVGLAIAVASYFFQALALAFGPLALVQPLVVTELVFAVPISARLQHGKLGVREWAGVIAVSAGLALAITAADPRGGNPLPGIGKWLTVLPAVGVVAIGAALTGRALHDTVRASMFGFAAATTLGTEAALLQSTTAVFRSGVVNGFTSWQPYAMAISSIAGLLLVQSAYQAGPLAASLPVMDAFEPTVAVLIGVTIFGEHVRTATLPVAGTATGIVILMIGIVALDTSPVVHKLGSRQRKAG